MHTSHAFWSQITLLVEVCVLRVRSEKFAHLHSIAISDPGFRLIRSTGSDRNNEHVIPCSWVSVFQFPHIPAQPQASYV